jgi:energy-coupling factor transporter ATP-binding protein EcfA2
MTSWQKFEKNVKTLASFIHNCDAQKENINGVDFDCVIKKEHDLWIIVEVTENETLNKVRTDIAKFAACKQFLFSQEIYSKFYLVLKNEPTNSMKTTANGAKIKVISYESFSKDFFDINSYRFARNQKIFGSSVNPISGKPDTHSYTPVHYENENSKKELSLIDISKYLKDGKRLVMLGNYGTGKSRCIRELFQVLDTNSTKGIRYTLAINLKEHWGTQRAEELIRRHLGGLGIPQMADSLMKILHTDKFIFLLDGFDEIGAQTWSSDSTKLKQIRASSLRAVKDLINTTSSPVLITGREHYFNSEKEMLSVLGLKKTETEIIKCKDEFTLNEMNEYIKNLSLTISLPIWLPRRPLICQIISTIDKDELEKIFIDTDNAIEFWNTLIENICKREARISTALEHSTIYKILLEIAEITRTKKGNTGPITIREINGAFEKVVGTAPVDDSAVMLQRLPGLSRVSSESTDRQFIDLYILDGLRADLLIGIVYSENKEFFRKKWQNPLSKTGIEIVAKRISNDRSANNFIQILC